MSTEAASSTMGPSSNSSNGASGASSGNASVQTAKPERPQATTTATFPPPKTDKPRPHVCDTCSRSFARLEHLKRHERSHTKEKPFECPQCTRCFARRDLLLRHQQKLHQQGATSSKPRNGRRESTTGLPPNPSGRVRKNSVAGSVAGGGVAPASMRPRANTISHIDPTALNSLLASHGASLGRNHGGHPGHLHHASLSGLGGPGAFDYRGMSTSIGHMGQPHGLPKLDTHLGHNLGGGLRTAPIPGAFGSDDFELEKFFGPPGSTINPNQLHHFSGALGASNSPFNPFANPFAGPNTLEGEDFGWNAGLENSIMFSGANENAVDGSSPSAISTASQSGFSEVMLDGSGQPTSAAMWHNPLATHAGVNPAAYSLDAMAPVFPELMMNTPKDLADQGAPEFYLSSPPPVSSMSPTAGIPGMPNQYFHPPVAFHSDTGSISSSSMNGSARHSSVTSVSTDTITDTTRQALIINLSQALGYGTAQRKFSQPQISSPLSATAPGRIQNQVASLPSTVDLQRYVNAYIQYFHPHLPFLHIPTLSFDTPAYTYHLRTAGNFNHDGMVGGGGCLILAMAAIGALYEIEHNTAKELFEAAKKMILYYLDERRRAGVSAAVNGPNSPKDSINKPPLWLVQAMLLNLIFGHNCGDRQAAEVASTHCAALVGLAKAAGLDKSPAENMSKEGYNQNSPSSADGDVEMSDDSIPPELFQKASISDPTDEHTQWIQWKKAEERKRTYFAVFSMSSLLVSAYAHAPRILNSEIRLDLPCEEDLWSVDNAQAWFAMGGPMVAQSKGLSFHLAMTYLLEASMRQQSEPRAHNTFSHAFGPNQDFEITESDIRPSTFGCYVLINALHVYIWETRQRHTGRLWKTQETEAMHAQVEPALKAWQTAWRCNPNHSIERPSPFGPLAADCIPLLDLAYVRLFVNLGRSKELLWQRDFDGMATELAKGVDIVATDGSPDRLLESHDPSMAPMSHSPRGMHSPGDVDAIGEPSPGHSGPSIQTSQSSKRERHLRKAAFYAADSLSMADKLGATYADLTARELPNSSAMCTFDCAQILAEWVATVQDRVGRFVGVLGKDEMDETAVPAIMLLEEEDMKLLHKIRDIIQTADLKLAYDIHGMGSSNAIPMLGSLSNLGHCGYGTKLLMVTAYMLQRSAVWPVALVMARALEAHANYINQRAEASVTAP